MTRLMVLLCAAPAWAQTVDAMLTTTRTVAWERSYRARAGCGTHHPAQMDIYATTQWTHHCVETRGGVVREYFYYVFGEPARTALLRVDLQPEGGVPLEAVQAALTGRFGPPDHAPELMEIGFRRLRFGQPVAGDHWKRGPVHYFLHANQTGGGPLGIRTGPQLIVIHERLLAERRRDESIHQVDGLGTAGGPARAPANPLALLRKAAASDREERARLLLSADAAIRQLAIKLGDAEAAPLRRRLARYGVKLGGQTHQGGLDYRADLLWRVWNELSDTAAGEQAFVRLQNHGWHIAPDEFCPPNPDLFRTVIEKGETFLAERPASRVRKEVLFSVAVAYESWWSLARAPADDPIFAAPYPRRAANARESGRARESAIAYYREVVRIAPESPEAASALRRLPRLELGLDTGQWRFFCTYC